MPLQHSIRTKCTYFLAFAWHMHSIVRKKGLNCIASHCCCTLCTLHCIHSHCCKQTTCSDLQSLQYPIPFHMPLKTRTDKETKSLCWYVYLNVWQCNIAFFIANNNNNAKAHAFFNTVHIPYIIIINETTI